MLDAILRHFPAHTHALTLVSDHDGLLNEEAILTELVRRGFTLIDEPDPVRLRYRVSALPPWTAQQPLIVITAEPLNALPYDLWQQGHHVTLHLHDFFPNLAYPLVRALSPSQRWQLSQAPAPPDRLGQRGTTEFVLHHVFEADLDALAQPAWLIAWLDRYHHQTESMPAPFSDHLLDRLRRIPAYRDWPLTGLLAQGDLFFEFVRDQWQGYVSTLVGQTLSERRFGDLLHFERDDTLQNTLPALVHTGTLAPVDAAHPERLPVWAQPGLCPETSDHRLRRVDELIAQINPDRVPTLADARWDQWQEVAREWAELTTLRYTPDLTLDVGQSEAIERLQGALDAAFLAWLKDKYAPLAGQRLPRPHHLYHVPHYIAYRRRQDGSDRVALLVLDGLALADWVQIVPVWRSRHPGWRFEEQLVLAQVPTLTTISRQALISGRRPLEFAATLDTTDREAGSWTSFWATEDLSAQACPCLHLALDQRPPPAEVDSAYVRALCLIDTRLDDMIHDATLGTRDLYASLPVWLEDYGSRLERLIDVLLARGFAVYLTSDHGHMQARGFGQPNEGLAVDTRGRRARIYRDRRAAQNAQQSFPDTVLWHDDGLLPDDVFVLSPLNRRAFDTFDKTVVTHGGLTLDEVIVPLVTIEQDKTWSKDVDR